MRNVSTLFVFCKREKFINKLHRIMLNWRRLSLWELELLPSSSCLTLKIVTRHLAFGYLKGLDNSWRGHRSNKKFQKKVAPYAYTYMNKVFGYQKLMYALEILWWEWSKCPQGKKRHISLNFFIFWLLTEEIVIYKVGEVGDP